MISLSKKTLVILLSLTTVSCSQYGAENLKGFIEYGIESKNYVRWTREQPITWDLFQGDVQSEYAYNNYFGLYFFYVLGDSLKFNATIYFDKTKSWVRPKEEWGEFAQHYDPLQKVLKLKFDYYEYTIRQLRKFLMENKNELTEEEVRALGGEYYNKAESEWDEIMNASDQDFSDEKLNRLREMIDLKLEELKDFDATVNSTF